MILTENQGVIKRINPQHLSQLKHPEDIIAALIEFEDEVHQEDRALRHTVNNHGVRRLDAAEIEKWTSKQYRIQDVQTNTVYNEYKNVTQIHITFVPPFDTMYEILDNFGTKD
jgi:UDP-N-acetylmuramyl pentapeptide synthase